MPIKSHANTTVVNSRFTPESPLTLSERFHSDLYELKEKIGDGGFGQVFRAVQNSTQQAVAIKILTLNSEFDADKRKRYIERFDRETIITAKLRHPNIVQLIDKGQCDDSTIFAVFEFVEGQTLKDKLRAHGALAANEAADVMGQVLSALAHAHKMGVIHRDIKPANIMLTQLSGKLHAKILDFGIGTLVKEARHLDFKSLTLTQETLGTPSYSAPEQLRGEPPTTKTDLYVWGLVFLECITGQQAISGSSLASIFHKQLSQSNVPLPASLAGHPVGTLLRRVLNKKANERSANTEEIYQDLMRLNFTTLVGDLTRPTTNTYPPEEVHIVADDTLVQSGSMAYTHTRERKQITVLCVSLSVSAVNQLTLDEIIDTLHRDQKSYCCDIAIRYGALHVGTLGDTLLFYFGYPSVSDNDCRLSARSALDIISELNKRNAILKYSQGIIIQARAGIHTGMVTAYADATPEGDTPNIAMELARFAQNNQIICSESSQKILSSYIEMDPWQVKNIGVNAIETLLYSIKGERHVEAFGFLRANPLQHYFVGRSKEIGHLSQLIQGDENKVDTRFVHVFGEAGIGKSRLVFELRNRAPRLNHYVAQCLPEFKNNALYPVLNIIRYQYSLDAYSPDLAITLLQDALENTKKNAGQTDINEYSIPLLCSWLDVPLPDEIQIPPLTPDIQKELLFDTLKNLLLFQAPSNLNKLKLFVFEDIHWADPSTLDFIRALSQDKEFNVANHVVITTSRHALPESLENLTFDCTEILKLENQATGEFIRHLFDNQSVASGLLALVVERTDGIPLFIEELVDMLKHKNLVQKINGVYDFTSPENLKEVPASLRDSLQQKLDDLSNAKEIAQLASTIGREFNYDLLLAASYVNEGEILNKLKELQNAGLVYVQRKVEGDRYIFKHALVRDAAYESMLPQARKSNHKHIAQALEKDNKAQSNTGLLAMHWSEAEDYEKAVKYGDVYASEALKRSSAKEAITHAEKTQQWIEHLDKDNQVSPKLRIYGLLTSAYMETKGWASEEVLRYSEASLALLKSSERHDELVSHLWWKVLNGIVGGKRQGLAILSEEMEILLDKVENIQKAAIKCAQGFYHFTQGNRHASISAFEASIKHYQREAGIAQQQVYGFDIDVFSKATLARAYADQDQKEKSLALSREALEQAKGYEHVPSIGISLMYYGIVHQQFHNRAEVEQSSNELITIAEKYDLPIYQLFGQMLHDWSISDVSCADEILEKLTAAGSRHGLGHFQSFYAETYAQQQQYDKAIEKIDECIALDGFIQEPNYLPYLLYKKAKYTLSHSDHQQSEAKDIFQQAKEVAQHQGVSTIVRKIECINKNLLFTTP